MKWKILLWIVLVFSAAGILFASESYFMQRSIADKTLRLHVVANSDSPEDQALKLRVRDRVLQTVQGLTADCKTAQEAEEMLAAHLDLIESSALNQLISEGTNYAVQVTLCEEEFDTRYYDTFTLPAGSYRSLRIRIGEAEGKNWWCVVFPSLCSAATSESVAECAQWNGYEYEESDLITGGEEKYVLRFKLLEWIQELFH